MDKIKLFDHQLGFPCRLLLGLIMTDVSTSSSTSLDAPHPVLDATHPLTAEELEPGLLYAVLTYRGELASWNWAFFVPNPAVGPIGTSGTIFHVVDTDSIGLWKFEIEHKRDVISSPHVVAILRLADVGFLGGYEDVVGKDSLLPMFLTVKIPAQASAEFSSRTWFLEAICVLHDCGVVQCDDAWLLEREIRRCAFTAMDRYLENKGRVFVFLSYLFAADFWVLRDQAGLPTRLNTVRDLWYAIRCCNRAR